jgi:hypothetical protein
VTEDPEMATDPLLATTHALHALAEQVLAADLYRHTGKIGLQITPGGFGTPRFEVDGGERRVRVDGVDLVVEADGHARREPLTTITAAAEFVEVVPEAPDVYMSQLTFDPDAPLNIDPDSAREIERWFGLVGAALDRFTSAHRGESPSISQLWPEHFDLAITLGEANYGGSPPDDEIPLPYLYVGPWKPRVGDFWTEPFGASLLADRDIDVEDAVAFFEEGRRHVSGDPAA